MHSCNQSIACYQGGPNMKTMKYTFNNPLLFVVTILFFTIGILVHSNTINADRAGHKLFKQNDGGQVLARNQRTKAPTSRRAPVIRKDIRRIPVQRDVRVKTRPRIYYRPNYRVRTLPRNYTRIVVRDKIYFYFSGIFYWPSDIGYVVINAPIGATVAYLPTGYISFYLGPRRYFYVNLTYFLWLPDTRQYIVVEKPAGADEAIAKTSATDLVIYPKKGQSDEQRDKDRAACHRWAVKESGYDPSLPASKTGSKAKYLRAIKACLEARGYIVK